MKLFLLSVARVLDSCLTASANTFIFFYFIFISRVNCVVRHDTNNFTCKCLVYGNRSNERHRLPLQLSCIRFFLLLFSAWICVSCSRLCLWCTRRWAFLFVSAKRNNHRMWIVRENVVSTWAVEILRKYPWVVFGGGDDVDDNIHCISTFSLDGRTTEISEVMYVTFLYETAQCNEYRWKWCEVKRRLWLQFLMHWIASHRNIERCDVQKHTFICIATWWH